MAAVDSEALREGAKQRRAALFKRWSTGARLTEAELAEIRGELEEAGANFALEAERAGGPAGKPAKAHRHYAAAWGISEATVSRLVADGRKANDPAPLDDPAALVGWWERHRKHRVPAWLVEAAAGGPAAGGDDRERGAGAGADPAALAELPETDGVGLDVALRQAEALSAVAYRRLREALAKGEGVTEAARAWERQTESLRKLQTTAPKVARETGSLVDAETVKAELARVHEAVAEAFVGAVERKLLEVAPDLDRKEAREHAEEARDWLALHLRDLAVSSGAADRWAERRGGEAAA